MYIKHLTSLEHLPKFRILSISEARAWDEERQRYKTEQMTNENGVPYWSLELLVIADNIKSKSEIVRLKYASKENPAEIYKQNDLIRLQKASLNCYKFYFDEFEIVPDKPGQEAIRPTEKQ